jgi:selenium metabolism protein YedF
MEEPKPEGTESKIGVLVGTDRMGKGDDMLGQKLITSLIDTLKEMGPELWRLILLNGGVKLTVEGSECLPALQAIEKEGTNILVCGTFLNHLELLEKKQVGETTNMLDIVTAMQLADKVISIM